MLAKGATNENILRKHTPYQAIFEKLFGKQYRKVMYLHKLSTLSHYELEQLFETEDKSSPNHNEDETYKSMKQLSKPIMKELFEDHLQLDKQSKNWFKNLLRIAQGSMSGLEFLGNEYDLSTLKLNYLKGVCSNEIEDMSPLLKSLNEYVPKNVSDLLAGILTGDVTKLADLIKLKIRLE